MKNETYATITLTDVEGMITLSVTTDKTDSDVPPPSHKLAYEIIRLLEVLREEDTHRATTH